MYSFFNLKDKKSEKSLHKFKFIKNTLDICHNLLILARKVANS